MSQLANRIAVSMTRSGVIVYASPNIVEAFGKRVNARFDKDTDGRVAVHLLRDDKGAAFSKGPTSPDHYAWVNSENNNGHLFLGSAFFGKTPCEIVEVGDGNVIALLPPTRAKPRNRKTKAERQAERFAAARVLHAPPLQPGQIGYRSATPPGDYPPKHTGDEYVAMRLRQAIAAGAAYDPNRDLFLPIKKKT